MKAIGYVRVSTADQANGLSLEAQQRAISEEVARRGWELAQVVTEAKSGKDLESRPELTSALERLDFAGEDHALVVSRLDRLARSTFDFCGILKRADKHGWTLLCLSPNVDMSDPYGKCMAQMAGAFAELERELISQRQKESVKARKAAGTYNGPTIAASPEALNRIRALMAAGAGSRKIAQQLTVEGFEAPTGEWLHRSVRRYMAALRES